MRWFLADVLGPFSVNVVSFSRNVVSVARIFSVNLVPKQRLFAVPAIYVLGPLQLYLFEGMGKNSQYAQVSDAPSAAGW